MSRIEFSAKIRDQANARAHGCCENKACGLPLQKGRTHYDHILPLGLGGKSELANCQVLCEPCHAEKTAREDVPRIRKADRQRRAELRIVDAPVIQSGPMATTKRAAERRARGHKPPVVNNSQLAQMCRAGKGQEQ